jgi:hypothetical protein
MCLLTAEYVMRSRASGGTSVRAHAHASPGQLDCILSSHPSIHCHPPTRSDYQNSKRPSFKNGFFPGSCPARCCPARQGGVFPSCVRWLVPRQLQLSFHRPFAALLELRRSAMDAISACTALATSPSLSRMTIFRSSTSTSLCANYRLFFNSSPSTPF